MHHDGFLSCPVGLGSSPLTRGARSFVLRWFVELGIIPAHAGCTPTCARAQRRGSDHPRSRGVHGEGGLLFDDGVGSSPLTRGARWAAPSPPIPLRIIPAHAGCTLSGSRRTPCVRDHPRSRGVHEGGLLRLLGVRGSSPLTRGALEARPAVPGEERIIPAHAGCTSRSGLRGPATWDHPRSRGVHRGGARVVVAVQGSSPLTRGARHPSTI